MGRCVDCKWAIVSSQDDVEATFCCEKSGKISSDEESILPCLRMECDYLGHDGSYGFEPAEVE